MRQSELFDAIMNALRRDAVTKPTVAPPAAMSDTAFLRANASLVVLLAEDNAINQEVASEMLDAFLAIGVSALRMAGKRSKPSSASAPTWC